MPYTSPVIQFYTINKSALKNNVTLSCNVSLQSFSTLNDLKTVDRNDPRPIATFEPNRWLLDGTFVLVSTNTSLTHIGAMGIVLSDAVGAFSTPPVLTCQFGSVQSSDGLTLVFDSVTSDYCNSITVAYYDASNALIRTDNYTPTSYLFSTGQAVASFKKIIVTFNSTSKPYRFFRLVDINFSSTVTMSGSEIKKASLVESIDPTSLTLPYNTLALTLYSASGGFLIMQPGGKYAAILYNGLPLYVYEVVNSSVVFIGKFYVERFDSKSDTVIVVQCWDSIGEKLYKSYRPDRFIDAVSTPEKSISTALSNLDTGYNIGYGLIIDPAASDTATGLWQIGNDERDGLQAVTLAYRAFATMARTKHLRVNRAVCPIDVAAATYHLLLSDQGENPTITPTPALSGLSVRAHTWAQGSDTARVIDISNIYGVWSQTFTWIPIVFGSPTISGFDPANVTYNGGNTISIFVPNGVGPIRGIVTFGVYTDNQQDIWASQGASAGSSITDKTQLINGTHAADVANNIYRYLVSPYLVKTKTFAPLFGVGDTILVDIDATHQIKGIVEKMGSELADGFVCTAEIRGVLA